jgi:hypothetical protein
MRKLYITLIALVLAVALIVPLAVPAYACQVKKPVVWPVSWVSWVGNEKQHLPDWPYTTSGWGKVTKLSDGTTVGYYISHDIDAATGEKRTYTCDNFTSSYFHDNVAEFYGNSYCKETGQSIRVHCLSIDNGELGRYKDQTQWWVWLPDAWDPEWGPAPQDWWPLLGPQEDMSDPAFGLPVKITAGNIDVHVGCKK